MPYIGYPRSLNAMSIIDEIAAKENKEELLLWNMQHCKTD